MNNPSLRGWRLLLLALLPFVAPAVASAQLESSIWYFGYKAGLDFRSGSVVQLSDGFDHQVEGTSTLSDPRTGQLVMHTDGDTVWNRNHQVMPNGAGIGHPTHTSSTQGATIVPMPEDSTRFYIISIDAGEYMGTTEATWSIVDMKLDGGLGAVTTRKQFLRSGVAEKIAVVKHCNGRGYWVIMHQLGDAKFLVYYLSVNGFEGPRVFDLGTPHVGSYERAIGSMKLNLKGDRLAVAIFRTPAIDLLDFDRRTGTLSNSMTIPVAPDDSVVYDVCFSPDGTKLYATGEQARYVAQYDVSSRSVPTIVASRYVVHRNTSRYVSVGHVGQAQVAPDGRVYVSIQNESEISVITDPNLAGAACGYRHRAIPLGRPYCKLGLPNIIHGLYDPTLETCRPPRARFRSSTRELCAGESLELTDESYDDPTAWQWTIPGGNPAATTQRHPGRVLFETPGLFRVELVASNENGTDTFAIEIRVNPRPEIDAGADRTICIGDVVQIGGSARDAATIRWTPSTGLSCSDCSDPVAAPLTTTTYRVVATSAAGCVTTDEVTVTVDPFPSVDAGRDTAICLGESVVLDGRGGSELIWSPATGLSCTSCANPIASPLVSTTYTLVTSNNGRCISIDSMRITVSPRPTADAGNDVRICRGTSTVLTATGGSRYEWSPAASLSCTECAEPTAYPDTTTTYLVRAFNASGCASIDSVTVEVDPAPRLVHADLGPEVRTFPGTELELPVMLQEPLDAAFVSFLEMTVDYDPSIMYLTRATLDSTLTEGWTVVVTTEDRVRGHFSARLFATNGATLKGSGVMARLRFQSFIHFGDSSTARLALLLPGHECTRIETTPTVVRLDSICGLSQRFIEMTGDVYALRQNSPNPFNPATTIDFSLGLDGPTLVEIVDLTGRTVAVLADEYMAPGPHSITWDASAFPSGLYYCRITSGPWRESVVMTLSK
jgi:PKD repeat protein